jgi:small-conductance mechanosensitive channel
MTWTQPQPAFLIQIPAPRTAADAVANYFTLTKFVEVLLILGLTWFIIRYSSRLLDALASQSPRARFVVRWVQPMIRIFFWFSALMLCFALVAPSTETFYAGLASAGIAIGLGAQDLVKNILGGLIILADRPFQLGDRVKVGEAYGEIDHIGLHSTKLTTPDDTRVTIANSSIVTAQVFNANSGAPDCQVVTDVFLPLATDPRVILRIGHEAACTCPFLLLRKPVVVLVSDVLADKPFARLRVKAYVCDHRYERRMMSDITARCKAEFLRLGLLGKPPRGELAQGELARGEA